MYFLDFGRETKMSTLHESARELLRCAVNLEFSDPMERDCAFTWACEAAEASGLSEYGGAVGAGLASFAETHRTFEEWAAAERAHENAVKQIQWDRELLGEG